MKTKILVLATTFSAILAVAQTPSTPPAPSTPSRPSTPSTTTPSTTSPTSRGTTGSGSVSPFGGTNQFNLGGTEITNSSGQTFSAEEIESQLTALRSAVQQTLPALEAVSQVYSNAAAGSSGVVGGIAGVLGGVLDRNTNNPSGQTSTGNTNVLGRILRDAISTATTNSSSGNLSQLQDLVMVQRHLQAINPIFDRLGISTNASMMPSDVGGTQNNSSTNSGSGKGGPGQRDQ